MRKKYLLLALITLSYGAAGGITIHEEAANCVSPSIPSILSAECLNVCWQCHPQDEEISPLDIYDSGDVSICVKCHEKEAQEVPGTTLLRFVSVGGGNHPVNILYLPENSNAALRDPPNAGPVLFSSEVSPNKKIHCSTCHDPKSNSINLLRITNSGSALCLACHDK